MQDANKLAPTGTKLIDLRAMKNPSTDPLFLKEDQMPNPITTRK
jgi:hypothetical protein